MDVYKRFFSELGNYLTDNGEVPPTLRTPDRSFVLRSSVLCLNPSSHFLCVSTSSPPVCVRVQHAFSTSLCPCLACLPGPFKRSRAAKVHLGRVEIIMQKLASIEDMVLSRRRVRAPLCFYSLYHRSF
jgi:hypothetical protein